ncbi:MAG: hypothetical protein HYV07_28810 [Deltaproteobacteria bacterium]|nr:hypothetical protein [Deltaproteobacteria bacterium]
MDENKIREALSSSGPSASNELVEATRAKAHAALTKSRGGWVSVLDRVWVLSVEPVCLAASVLIEVAWAVKTLSALGGA